MIPPNPTSALSRVRKLLALEESHHAIVRFQPPKAIWGCPPLESPEYKSLVNIFSLGEIPRPPLEIRNPGGTTPGFRVSGYSKADNQDEIFRDAN